MDRYIKKYNQAKSTQNLIQLQEKFIDYIERKFDFKNQKYYFDLFLLDDICFKTKFWFKISLLWYWKKWFLENKFVIEWKDIKDLFLKVLDFVENNKEQFINPFYTK